MAVAHRGPPVSLNRGRQRLDQRLGFKIAKGYALVLVSCVGS
jgi:hypothetical protein